MAPLVAATAAAGVAVGVYAAALGPQIKAMGEAVEAEEEYADAVEESGARSADAVEAQMEYARQMMKLPPATRSAAAALSVLKDEYKEWSDSLAADTMAPFTKGLALAGNLLPKLTPLVRGTSAELDRMVTLLAGGMESPGFDRLVAKFSDFSRGSLARVNSGIVRLIENLDSGKVEGGLSEFMAYARQNGPLVADTLRNIGESLANLLIAGADVGVGMLEVVNALTQLAAAVPSGLVTTLLQVAVAFKLIKLGGAAFAFVGTAAAAATGHVAAFIRSARFGGVSAAVSGLTQRFTVLQKAGAGLAVLGIAAMAVDELAKKARGAPPDVDRLSTSLKELALTGKFGGELKSTFGTLAGMGEKFRQLRVESEGLKAAEPWIALSNMGPAADYLAGKFDDLTRGAEGFAATKEDFAGLDQALADLVSSGYADEAAANVADFTAILRANGATAAEAAAMFPQYKNAVAGAKLEQEIAARAMGAFGEQAVATQGKLNALRQGVTGLQQSVHALNQTVLQSRGDVRAMESAIDAATAAIKQNGRTLDENTEKGRANNAALDAIAATTMKAVEAKYTETGSWEAAMKVYQRGRGELEKSARGMGLTRAQAKALADQILRTPDKTARLKANSDDLKAKLKDAQARLKNAPLDKQGKIRAEINQLKDAVAEAHRRMNTINGKIATTYITTVLRTVEERVQKPLWRSRGGLVRGPGTETSDSIPTRLSDNEFVVNARQTKRYLPLLRAINAGQFNPGMAAVPPPRASAMTGGGGGRTVIIHAPVTIAGPIDAMAAGREVERVLTTFKRNNGGGPLSFERG
ncbi:hypothetical protein QMZ92_16315 [Streptomyces sp. HNM0645]|uniref:hypothetical protein n=1 Tax=Streptomyces sp. HNM0645 TaxID=2782343 RepID=UPI0024B79622|nr:hypothetical protein [Streptomyces sp. HNM0645]MDI9885899.1 hypothetical protein [Streptomyces sp. HNM0645]